MYPREVFGKGEINGVVRVKNAARKSSAARKVVCKSGQREGAGQPEEGGVIGVGSNCLPSMLGRALKGQDY